MQTRGHAPASLIRKFAPPKVFSSKQRGRELLLTRCEKRCTCTSKWPNLAYDVAFPLASVTEMMQFSQASFLPGFVCFCFVFTDMFRGIWFRWCMDGDLCLLKLQLWSYRPCSLLVRCPGYPQTLALLTQVQPIVNCIEISWKFHGKVATCSGLKSVSFLGLRARVFRIWLTESWQQVATDWLSWKCMVTWLRRLDKTAQKSVSSSLQFISQFSLHRTFLFRDP